MYSTDTQILLFYILNIFLNINECFIPFLNLYRICMYSMWCDGRLNTDINVSETCDLCEHNIRISLCQVSGGQNVTIPTQFLLREHIYYCESYNSRLDYVRESRLDFL